MKQHEISVLILTYNEQPNIERCLERLKWTSEVVVVDSGSNDETLAICQKFPNVRVVFRAFDSFASQCNFGLTQISTDWVLSIDADYVVPHNFVNCLQQLSDKAAGYSCSFRYLIFGQPLRSCLYPSRTVLYRRSKAQYQNIGHGHRVTIDGPVLPLEVKLDHDDRKSLSRWLNSQRNYAAKEAEHLQLSDDRSLGLADRVRKKIWLAAPAVMFYVFIWKRNFLDGWPGIYYTMQRTYAELLLSLELLDRKLRSRQSSVDSRQESQSHQ